MRLGVRDTGEGIPSDVLPHVFERFYRVNEARQTHGAESGLGLAIAKALIELHGGTIAVHSQPGLGTEFTLSLPSDPADGSIKTGGGNPCFNMGGWLPNLQG